MKNPQDTPKTSVRLYEVGARDGLQNEAKFIATTDKIRLIDSLSLCGFSKIEATSFVSPKWVPQMADAAEVMAGISRKKGVSYAVLTPNLQGLTRAIEAKADEVAVFIAASETFSQRNINCTIEESLKRVKEVISQAKIANLPVRGYLSCVVGCPYEGAIAPAAVAKIAASLYQLGIYELSLGDTIGVGTPATIKAMLKAVSQEIPYGNLAGHYHDTGGQAIANIAQSLELGLSVFDSAVGGLGGCPYAPGASGNVATEAVADFLDRHGFETGLELETLNQAAALARMLRST